MPSAAIASFSASTRARTSSHVCDAPCAPRTLVERASSTSGAPLTKHRTAPSISWNVAMSLYSASNGTSATRGYVRRVASTSSPALAASTTTAPSVGSPTHAPSRITASLASAMGSANGSSGTSPVPATDRIRPTVEYPSPSIDSRCPAATSVRAVIWLSVSVPVLSEQIADVEPSVSTDLSRLTIAPFSAS